MLTLYLSKNLRKHECISFEISCIQDNKVKKNDDHWVRIKSYKLERPFDVGYIFRIYRVDPTWHHDHVLEFSIACFLRL